jgi:hypothetical protein|tara:strand:+ start:847 stop:2025 length:1179 start_codon:yes stop_codon:yes gene_type:complete
MAFTSKISQVLKGRVNSGANSIKGFVDGAVGNINSQIDNFTSSFTGLQSAEATKAKAASILNSSPLEIGQGGAVNPNEALKDRFQFGTVYYPEETSNLDEGHYVIIDIIQHNKSAYNRNMSRKVSDPEAEAAGIGEPTQQEAAALSKAQERLRQQQSGINQGASTTHSRISDSVCIYTPGDAVKFSYAANYESLATGLAGLMASSMEAGKSMDLKEAITQGGGQMLERVLGEAVVGIASALPGVGDIRGAIDKSMGRALNPFNEQVFRSVPFREFAFPFVFAPKNRKEMETVQKILKLFRFHMLPEFSNKTKGAFLSPSEFQITYMYRNKQNRYIPHISRCVLKNLEVDYATEGQFHTFREDDTGAAPITTTMTATFAETEIMTKEMIGLGY